MQLQKHDEKMEQQSIFGPLCPGQKKLLGKTFYLDSVKKRLTAVLLETIPFLGGGVESFLHKDVSFVVTGNQEGLDKQKDTDIKAVVTVKSEEAQHPIMSRERRPGTPRPAACGSRGKALLEKAIRNYEQQQKSSVLANARSWGVKILYVDDVISLLKQLARESLRSTHKKTEKTHTKKASHVVKAASLRSPYLKIEDSSRKYKPLHMQSMTFPSLQYLGRFSPFESPPPPQFDKWAEHKGNSTRKLKESVSSPQEKPEAPLSFSPSPWRPRKKAVSYCECCRQAFSNLEEHLQSNLHRDFVLDPSNYSAVDQLVAEMLPDFDPDPPEQPEETLELTGPLSRHDGFELETLDEAEVENAVRALQRRGSSLDGSSLGRCRSPVAARSGSPSPGLLFPLQSPATPSGDIQMPGSPTMPVLDAEPSVCDASGVRRLLSCPDCLSPSPDLYAFPPVLSPQIYHLSDDGKNHPLYSDPPVLSPQRCVGAGLVSPPPSDASPPPLEEVMESIIESKKETDLRCSVLFSRESRKRQQRSKLGRGQSKRRKEAKNSVRWNKGATSPSDAAPCSTDLDDSSLSDGDSKSLYRLVEDGSFDAPRLVHCAEPRQVSPSRDCPPSLGLSTSLSIESALIPDLHRLSSPSSDSDWDSGLLSRLGRASANLPALPDPVAALELDTELLHRPCACMQDSGYESRLHTVLQPQAAGVGAGTGPLCSEDMDSSAFSRTLVKIVEVKH